MERQTVALASESARATVYVVRVFDVKRKQTSSAHENRNDCASATSNRVLLVSHYPSALAFRKYDLIGFETAEARAAGKQSFHLSILDHFGYFENEGSPCIANTACLVSIARDLPHPL